MADDGSVLRRTMDELEFDATLIFDEVTRRGAETGITKRSGVFRVTTHREAGTFHVRSARRVGAYEELGFTAVPDPTLDRAPRLVDTPLSKLMGAVAAEFESPKLPAIAELAQAVLEHCQRDVKSFDALLGTRAAAEMTEIESIEPTPFADGESVEPTAFFRRVLVRGKRKDGKSLVRIARQISVNFVLVDGKLQVKHGRPDGTATVLATLSIDSAVLARHTSIAEQLTRGQRLAVTGDGAEPVAAAPLPARAEIEAAFERTLKASVKNFDAIMGKDAAKSVVEIDTIVPDESSFRRMDPQNVQGFVDVTYRSKRFDNVLLVTKIRLAINVRETERGRFVSGARIESRPQELRQLKDISREEVARMPLYVEKKATTEPGGN